MKRFLWLTSLVFLLPLAVTACGDDTKGGSSDGGVTQVDIDQLNDDLDDLRGDIDAGLGELDDRLTDLANEASDRLDALENPDVPQCSDNELCLPDGLDFIEMGIAGIIEALCNHEVNCCNADELKYKFGPGITNLEECVQTFTDLVNNGFSPGFVSAGEVTNNIVRIAAAINNGEVNVEIKPAGVEACLDFLNAQECPKWEEGEEGPDRCSPWEPEEDQYPCDIEDLITGLQAEGEQCGFIWNMPECADGTVCRAVDEELGGGICVKKPEVDERCTSNHQCDDDGDFDDDYEEGSDSTLYCNRTSGTCQELGGLGDSCKPIKSYTGDPRDADATSEDCKAPYQCDVVTHKCVAPCSKGAFCYAYSGNNECPEDHVCNVTEIPALRNRGYGICRKETATGSACTQSEGTDECKSHRCGPNDQYDGYPDPQSICIAAKVEAGETCPTATVAGPNDECEHGYCDGHGECSTPCTGSDDCESGDYCDNDVYIDEGRGCNPLIANGTACHYEYNTESQHGSCVSGFCNAGTCEAKAAADGACASGSHEQCPATQYCLAAVCTNLVANGGDCSLGGNPACVAGSYCNGSVCVAFAEEGDDCTSTQCESGTSCADIEAGDECHEPGDFPNGAYCDGCWYDENDNQFCYDEVCKNGWCPYGTYRCATKVAVNDDCDVNSNDTYQCVDNAFCDHPELPEGDPDSGKGTCERKGTVGDSCDPRFEGSDCLNGDCNLTNDAYICGSYSIAEETRLCDGE